MFENKTQFNSNYIPILDSLRALAAISVCVFHFVVGPINFINEEAMRNIFGYGKYGVQLFFVISGFIIPWSLNNKGYKISSYFKFLIKRLVRLEPPYIFSVLLVILLFFIRFYFFDETDSRNFTLTQVLLHVGYLIPFFENYHWVNEVYWTLAIEFQFYFFIGIAYFALTSNYFVIRLSCFILFMFVHFIASDKFLPYWLPVFLLGSLLFLLKTKKIGQLEYYTVTLATLGFILFKMSLPILISCLLPVFFILYFEKLNFAIGAWLGKISYSIYLIHTIIGSALINVLSHHVSSSFEKILVIILGILSTILFSYITYICVEKKSQKYSSNLTY